MAVQYARELALWGIETSIIVHGAFTGGTITSSIPARPPTRSAQPGMKQGHTKAVERKYRKPLQPLFRPTRMRAQCRTQSLKSWTRRLANARSAFI
jgi:hypothetical protein